MKNFLSPSISKMNPGEVVQPVKYGTLPPDPFGDFPIETDPYIPDIEK